ncbi:EAL domain-containing protein [Cellulomonas sp. ATA003]|nr:EAL domain-containing protein [Cellulomonas sp. ATA003]WNB87466.1 EAL domain-containing protein [Cellulomonas sp. ATA003]
MASSGARAHPPDQFIPQAERSGAILDVGHLVLRRALADAARWPAGPHGRRRVAVNVSGPELADPRYLGRVHEALRRSGLPADALILEITEGLLDVESDVVIQTLRHLRSQGVRVAMDDFGTGYSSLARLGRLDLDLLKVDRSFVSTIRTASSDAPLVSSILALAAALDLTVVAEGVETPEQAAWLRDRGCQEGQGHLWSRAVPADEVGVLMTARAGGSVPHPRRDDADADTDDAALPAALEPA